VLVEVVGYKHPQSQLNDQSTHVQATVCWLPIVALYGLAAGKRQ